MAALDKYARDARTWAIGAEINRLASRTLFENGRINPSLFFPAVTLGHHALEMYLKTTLICEGMTVFNPKDAGTLDPSIGLKPSECVWGHNLVGLAKQLSAKRPDFNLSAEMNVGTVFGEPLTVEQAFATFDPFFSELRYPQELRTIAGFGEHELYILEELVSRLAPFIKMANGPQLLEK